MYRSCRSSNDHIVAFVNTVVKSVLNISYVAVILEDLMKVFWFEFHWDVCSQTELSVYLVPVEGKDAKTRTAEKM